jgi:hypothetical protein
MKFDTPATTNPIDQLKVVGQPLDRIDGRLKTTGHAPYAYEHHDAVRNQAYGYVVGAAIAKGRITGMDTERRQGRARGDRHRHRRECRAARQGQAQHGQAAGRPGGRPLPPGDRRGGRRDLRAGTRCRALVKVDYAGKRGASTSPRRQGSAPGVSGQPRAAHRTTRWATSRPPSRSAGAARRHLHHAGPVARDDGAASPPSPPGAATAWWSGPRTR